jgi:hypothetical protein
MAPDEHAEPQNRNVSICFGSPIGQRHMLGRSSRNLTRTDAASGPDLLRGSRSIMSRGAASRLPQKPPLDVGRLVGLPILAILLSQPFHWREAAARSTVKGKVSHRMSERSQVPIDSRQHAWLARTKVEKVSVRDGSSVIRGILRGGQSTNRSTDSMRPVFAARYCAVHDFLVERRGFEP